MEALELEAAPLAGGNIEILDVRTDDSDFARAKRTGERWAMLTSYDQYTASIFDDAGVWALLVSVRGIARLFFPRL